MKIKYILFFMLVLAGCGQTVAEKSVANQLRDFPESRVQDIYKSFCQDYLGPEHLIPDPEYAKAYLESELRTYREDIDSLRYGIPALRYYPVGDQGNYVRVDLSVVLDSLITKAELLDAFVRSANSGIKTTPERWVEKWREIAGIIRIDFPGIPDETADLQAIDSLVNEGRLILHHSRTFVQSYHPHYRIISKEIFENELRARIDQ